MTNMYVAFLSNHPPHSVQKVYYDNNDDYHYEVKHRYHLPANLSNMKLFIQHIN